MIKQTTITSSVSKQYEKCLVNIVSPLTAT